MSTEKTISIFDLDETLEEVPEASEYISSLFQAECSFVCHLHPVERITRLKELKKNILKNVRPSDFSDLSANEEFVFNLINSEERRYLINILEGMLCPKLQSFSSGETYEDWLLNLVFREFGFLDFEKLNKHDWSDESIEVDDSSGIKISGELLQKLANDTEKFKYLYFNSRDTLSVSREKIINDLFQSDLDSYLSAIREKIIIAGKSLFKQILFNELCNLKKNEEIEELIRCLMSGSAKAVFDDLRKPSILIPKDIISEQTISCLFSDGQKQFYKTIQVIVSKLRKGEWKELPEDDKNLLLIYLWIKTSYDDCINAIDVIRDYVERKEIYSSEKPNMLYMHIRELELDIEQILLEPDKESTDLKFSDADTKTINQIISKVNNLTLDYCKQAYMREANHVEALKSKLVRQRLKKATKYVSVISLIIMALFLLNWSINYFFNISSIYENRFLKSAEAEMKTIPYPRELKDTLNPVENEIRQKERLDNIKELNLRYFKVLSLYLSPELPKASLEKITADIPLSEAMKDRKSIYATRNVLSRLVNTEEWVKKYEPLIGLNVLTQLRAYGAITNFLIPSLPHHVIKNEQGLPTLQNSRLQIYSPPAEKDILKRNLLTMYMNLPAKDALNPSVYIDKYDDNYRDIVLGTKLLLIKVQNAKMKTIREYKKNKSKQREEELKNVLQVISLLEVRLKDLIQKIKERHDHIVVNNTYRAILD